MNYVLKGLEVIILSGLPFIEGLILNGLVSDEKCGKYRRSWLQLEMC